MFPSKHARTMGDVFLIVSMLHGINTPLPPKLDLTRMFMSLGSIGGGLVMSCIFLVVDGLLALRKPSSCSFSFSFSFPSSFPCCCWCRFKDSGSPIILSSLTPMLSATPVPFPKNSVIKSCMTSFPRYSMCACSSTLPSPPSPLPLSPSNIISLLFNDSIVLFFFVGKF